MDREIEELLQNYPDRLVGLKQVFRGFGEGTIWCVIVSSDSDERIRNEVKAEARRQGVTVECIDSMSRLGKLCGIAVSAWVVGLIRK